MLVIGLLSCTPFVWLALVGKLDVVERLLNGDRIDGIRDLLTVSLHDSLFATGATLLVASILYHQLPIGLVPGFIPVVGKIDKLIAKIAGLIGIGILVAARTS